MEASISRWRATLAVQNCSCSGAASGGQSSGRSLGISHSGRGDACVAPTTAPSCASSGLNRPLPFLPDHVDLGVVGDGLEGDVGHALVHESVADVVVGGRVGRRLAGDLGFLQLPVAAVGKQVPGIARPHDAGAGERQGDAGGVDGDPASAPLLGDVGGGAGAAGGIEDEVAGVGDHEDAALNNPRNCLYDIRLR